MSFLSSMNISASALTAERLRLDIIAENVSNVDTTRTENGEPYRRKLVVFEAKGGGSFQNSLNDAIRQRDTSGKVLRGDSTPGVRVSAIIEDNSALKTVYNPEHPDADVNGYVQMPNVDMLQETIDSMSATRSYQANITVLNAVKLMAQKALDIGR
ncbi:flagellar basal body rod protein FlgC [Clostridium aminobutyricum]|uniref:Flagellar basal-body rod protein FlgC n=1 Tax=Clostridium aminobutyricum TaxID=33953 RepID=A0A939IJN9_CLOAM|nr:flagellar basal body rod protein FlgC [Clostridium aminobutyricum]MBN7773774.1 flagellar basal body rod protein FlgC [Clostridium aminobutyricum]